MKDKKSNLKKYIIIACIICFCALFGTDNTQVSNTNEIVEQNALITNLLEQEIVLENIPEYSGNPYITLNENVPYFEYENLTTTSFESYSELDSLGRCNTVVANIGQDIMPTEDRGNIGMVKPTGWHTIKYDGIDGLYLYNRCHLIAFQLTGENANIQNLITGTRYMNVEGMLPFENMIADYVKETGNHVMYRVTPIFKDENLLASGVVIEAKSVEDNGEGILFNVYCYNVQPGIEIDYVTGESKKQEKIIINTVQEKTDNTDKIEYSYVLNTRSYIFHYTSCSSVKRMSDKNRKDYTGTRDEVISMGYKSCGNCYP